MRSECGQTEALRIFLQKAPDGKFLMHLVALLEPLLSLGLFLPRQFFFFANLLLCIIFLFFT